MKVIAAETKMQPAVVVLLLHVLQLYTANSLQIRVDPVNGNNAGCQDGSHPCRNITTALNVRQNDVQYILFQGTHYLDQSVSDFVNLRNIYIGKVSASATVYVICLNNSGLAFANISNTTIQGAIFVGCGMVRSSATCDPRFFNSSASSCYLAKIRAALYFYLSAGVALYNVTVQDSANAAGLVLYDTVGTNTIANCSFVRNGMLNNTTTISSNAVGGGGVHIEFSYCTPGLSDMCNFSTPSQILSVSNTNYLIYRNYFGANSAQTAVVSSTFIRPSKGYQTGLGCGGGLSVLFYGFSSNNNVSISDCVFESNTGVVGGGLALESRDFATGNSVSMSNCLFFSNGGSSNGGGLSIVDIASAGSINISISHCVYNNNSALIGGAVSISVTPNPYQWPNYLFQYCTFQRNIATKIGTAVAAFLQLYTGNSAAPVLKISGKSFVVNNTLGYSKGSYDIGIGTIYTSGIPVVYDGQIIFEGNKGSALVSEGTYVDFCSCNATFLSNQGLRGGAIALYSNSYILLCNSSIMNFANNSASIDGGAIYNSYVQQTNAECFMRYSDPHLLPSEWKAKFVFIGNIATFGGNAIHSSSILPCSDSSGYPLTTFCWNEQYWNYGGDACTEQIATEPSSIVVNGSVKAFPGQIFPLPFVVRDDLQHNTLDETIFAASIADFNRSVAGVSDGFTYISNGFIQLYGGNHGNVTLELNEVSFFGWHLEVSVELLDCPPGLLPVPADNSDPGINTCTCSEQINENYGSSLLCSSDGFGNAAALLKLNHWMGYYPGTRTLVVGTCPPGYCMGSASSKIQDQYVQLPVTVDELDGTLCTSGRTGVLCSDCIPGYGVAINSLTFQCVPCHPSSYPALYVFLSLFSMIIVPALIIIAGNYVTNGSANAMILVCQLIASNFDLTVNGEIDMNYVFPNHGQNMVKAYRCFYGLFNLDGLLFAPSPFCLGSNLGVLGVIGLKYIASVLPLTILSILTICCCRKSVLKCCVQKYCKKNRHPIQIIVAFILLSFNNICITTAELLNSQSLIDQSGTRIGWFRSFYAGNQKWMWYLLPLFLIPVLLPIVLFLCGCKHTSNSCMKWLSEKNWCSCVTAKWKSYCNHGCVSKRCGGGLWETCGDAFYACYKPEMQWFAAAYFFVRIAVSSAYILAEPGVYIFAVQQITCIITIMVILIARPYKEEILNMWDAGVFTYLIILSTLSQYNVAVYSFSYQMIWIKVYWCIQFIMLILPFFLWGAMICCNFEKTFVRLGNWSCCQIKKGTHNENSQKENETCNENSEMKNPLLSDSASYGSTNV